MLERMVGCLFVVMLRRSLDELLLVVVFGVTICLFNYCIILTHVVLMEREKT